MSGGRGRVKNTLVFCGGPKDKGKVSRLKRWSAWGKEKQKRGFEKVLLCELREHTVKSRVRRFNRRGGGFEGETLVREAWGGPYARWTKKKRGETS